MDTQEEEAKKNDNANAGTNSQTSKDGDENVSKTPEPLDPCGSLFFSQSRKTDNKADIKPTLADFLEDCVPKNAEQTQNKTTGDEQADVEIHETTRSDGSRAGTDTWHCEKVEILYIIESIHHDRILASLNL